MLPRLVEIFCEIDDFCKRFYAELASRSIGDESQKRGPDAGLCESEIMTIIIILHGSQYKNLKSFYNSPFGEVLRKYFPGMPCYERFVAIQKRVTAPLVAFMAHRFGRKTGIYYIDSTSLPVCHNKRINRHKTFKGIAERGKTSMAWFFGFKLHLVVNHLNEIVAAKLTAGNVADINPVEELTATLKGKLFGDKGYIGKKLVESLMQRGLALMTRVRKNMKTLPMAMEDKMLLNKRNMVETIIGNIKEFSSLNVPKHRSIPNAFLHILAAVTAYQINPISAKKLAALPG
jgi:hypothetical protein